MVCHDRAYSPFPQEVTILQLHSARRSFLEIPITWFIYCRDAVTAIHPGTEIDEPTPLAAERSPALFCRPQDGSSTGGTVYGLCQMAQHWSSKAISSVLCVGREAVSVCRTKRMENRCRPPLISGNHDALVGTTTRTSWQGADESRLR